VHLLHHYCKYFAYSEVSQVWFLLGLFGVKGIYVCYAVVNAQQLIISVRSEGPLMHN